MSTERNIALNVIARMEAFQRDMLSKIPGISEQAASKAALKMQSKFASEEAKRVKAAEKAAKQAAGAWDTAFNRVFAMFSVKAIAEFAKMVGGARQELADFTNEMGDLSAMTGVSVETLNAFRFAAETNGGTLKDLQSAFKGLPKRLDDFRRGTGEARAGLEKLGFVQEDAAGMLVNFDAATREIVDRLQRVEDPAKRAAAATAIFGEAGVRLAQVVGDRSIEQWVDTADRFGADVGPAAVKAAQEWQQRTAVLSNVWTKFKSELIETFKIDDLVLELGVAFVTVFTGAADFVDRVIEGMGWLATTIRHFAKGDMKGAQAAIHQYAKSAKEMWTEIVPASLEAGKAFRAEAIALRQSGQAAEGLRQPIEETSDETKKAAESARKYASDLARVRSEYDSFVDLMGKVKDDVISAEEKIRAEQRARWAEVHALHDEEIISTAELADAIEAINARANRDIVALRAGRAAEEQRFREELIEAEVAVDETIRQMESDLFEWRVSQLSTYVSMAQDAFSQVADFWADSTDRQLEKDKGALDKLKGNRDELKAKIEDTDNEATKARLQNRLADLNSEIAAQKQVTQVRRMNAKSAARAQKAAALFGIGVRSAELALALAFPPPVGLGPIAGPVAAATMGIVQGAIVAATPLPSFYTGTKGGGVSSTANYGYGPGAVPTLQHAREEVLTSDAADRVGRDKIAAWNAGADPGGMGGGVGDVYLDLDPVGRVMARSARRAGPLRDTIHRGRPIGARNPYGRN